MVVARTGPIAPPKLRNIVFMPNPTAVLSLGTETEIMLTMGIIIETTPTSEPQHPTQVECGSAVEYDNDKPTMLIEAPRISMAWVLSLSRVCP